MISRKAFGAVVLAAGEGRRMGRQKALVTYGEETFLTIILNSLASVPAAPVVVVIGHHHKTVLQAHQDCSNVTFVVNEQPQDGQISSLQCALRDGAARWRAVLVTLVDHPAIAVDSFRAVMNAADAHPGHVIIPTYLGRRGHPVVFPSTLFEELLAADLPEGARTVMKRHPEKILEVALGDSGIVVDVDTPEDMHRLKKCLSGRQPSLYNANLEER